MTQILNVSMPADEAMRIIRNIIASNSMVRFNITLWNRTGDIVTQLDGNIYIQRYEGDKEMWANTQEDQIKDELITINSITPIIPKYEIGDKVMILATGEIETITDIDCEGDKLGVSFRNFTNYYHRSEICKIA